MTTTLSSYEWTVVDDLVARLAAASRDWEDDSAAWTAAWHLVERDHPCRSGIIWSKVCQGYDQRMNPGDEAYGIWSKPLESWR